MYLDKEKGEIFEHLGSLKPLCAAAILCSCLFASPLQTYAAGKSSPAAAAADLVTVKGVVIDAMGDPIIGANIVQVGTTNGTITDFDGNFLIKVPAGAMLDVSYIGYETNRVKVTPGKNMRIVLTVDTKTLDDVVVIGYGAMKKRDLTGAVASVKSDDITLAPSNNPMQALQGKIAGFDITKSSGQAGAGVNMQLRGVRSFDSSAGTPTFIIDGLPGDYATLNPNDIESIEILKDASSTAVYGAEGANGVVIITTKSGQQGKVKVNFNAYAGFNGWAKTPKMRLGQSYIETMREAYREGGNYSTDENMLNSAIGSGAYENYEAGNFIDWTKELLQTGNVQNYSLSVSGGTERTQAYVSFNYSDENGQYKNDRYQVLSTKIRIDHNVAKWAKIGVNVQGSYVNNNKAYQDLEGALCAVPLGKLYNEDGSLNILPNNSTFNLLLDNDEDVYRNQAQNTKIYFNPYIELSPIKGLTFTSRVNGSLTFSRSNYFQGEGSYQYYTLSGASSTGTNGNVYARITNNRGYGYKWENVLNYKFTLAEKHDFDVTAASSWNHNQNDVSQLYQDKILNNSYLWYNMSGGTGAQVYSTYSMSKSLGLIGRINYSFMGKYLASVSVRQDVNSRLADGHKSSTFPAASIGWRISDESFMEGTKDVMNNLKLRVSYGESGSTANIAPYQSVANIEKSYTTFGGEQLLTEYYSKNITNMALTWERSKNINVGIDAAFLNDRINVTLDYYLTKTTGVIWTKSVPVNNGAYSATANYTISENIAETKNNGFEAAINTRNIDTPVFKWNSALTFSLYKDEVTKLVDGAGEYVSNGTYTLHKGSAVNSYYDYKIDGIWQTSEADEAAIFGCAPGDIKINVPGLTRVNDGGEVYYRDKDSNVYDSTNKYTYSSNDYQIIGHNTPSWTLGFQNTFIYKNFDLTVYMYMRFGQMIKYSMLTRYDPSGVTNFPEYFNYWTSTNASNDFPALNSNKALKDYTGYSALQFVDGSFFKVKNITLGYTLPASISKKFAMEKLRIYATLTNPLVMAKSSLLKDYDPEMNGSLDYPLTKQFVFGLNVAF